MAEQRTLDAERADFEAWALKCGFKPTTFSHRVGASYLNQYLEDYWTCWQAARRAPPALDAEGLPELPEPYGGMLRLAGGIEPVYTAEQVRQAQRDVVAADRRARGMVPSQMKVPDQLARQSAPEGAPVAWSYEILQTVEPEIWCEFISRDEPTLGPKWIRNVQPLYATAAPTSASAQPEVSVTNYGDPVDKINMAQAGVGERAHGYVAGWNDCVDEHSRASPQPADQNKMEKNDE